MLVTPHGCLFRGSDIGLRALHLQSCLQPLPPHASELEQGTTAGIELTPGVGQLVDASKTRV